eukprot:gb/GECH01000076.1/.p1 GENE.gb/GECH01000076.1/~~gb/GECH01000076.1/.p1  ORF type:complete len:235 (+),score=41.92 gb/GECH01000076.1/:1-705(+)
MSLKFRFINLFVLILLLSILFPQPTSACSSLENCTACLREGCSWCQRFGWQTECRTICDGYWTSERDCDSSSSSSSSSVDPGSSGLPTSGIAIVVVGGIIFLAVISCVAVLIYNRHRRRQSYQFQPGPASPSSNPSHSSTPTPPPSTPPSSTSAYPDTAPNPPGEHPGTAPPPSYPPYPPRQQYASPYTSAPQPQDIHPSNSKTDPTVSSTAEPSYPYNNNNNVSQPPYHNPYL